jgi:predicted transcriptional regulator
MRKIVTVGGTLEQDGEAVIAAIERIERGEDFEPEDHVNFANWSALAAVMTDKRLELLQHLRRQPEANIRQLAQALGRDYKHVYGDVERLEQAGLIDRDDQNRLCVLWSEIQAVLRLDSAA